MNIVKDYIEYKIQWFEDLQRNKSTLEKEKFLNIMILL